MTRRPATILVAEDDPHIRQGLVDTLESEGYRVLPARDGVAALVLYDQERPDLLLLDVMMPGKSGFDVCREVRRRDPDTPVLMLTAKGEEVDKVVGLELGADDYVTKPFGVRELLARIAAVLRRCNGGPAPGAAPAELPATLRFGVAEIDRPGYRGRLAGRSFDLTARELALIEQFARQPDQVLHRDELLRRVWGVDYGGTIRTLDQHVAQLRKKIEPEPAHPRVITTVHGVGYRYQPGDEK
jgi:DNA-binding response OmpR family regulator